ncbi:hypothetical protein V8F33_001284 [Rhypophila sp. PSN 637]
MRPLAPLLNKVGTKASPVPGPHSDRLWKVYQQLLTNKKTNPAESEDGYYLTDTILDLDAADSPVTRPYNKTDHGEQIKKWGTNHALVALTKRMHAFRDDIELAKTSWKCKLHRFDERYITERDILSMAFLGPGPSPSTTGAKKQQLSYELLKGIGIHSQIAEDIPLTIRCLAHRRETQSSRAETSPNIRSNPSQPEPKTSENETIKILRFVIQKNPPSSLPRIIYALLDSNNKHHGGVLISKCLPEIISSVTKYIETMPPEDALHGTIFLQNICYNLSTKNLMFDDDKLLVQRALQSLVKIYDKEFPTTTTPNIAHGVMAAAAAETTSGDSDMTTTTSENRSGGGMLDGVSGAIKQATKENINNTLPLN